MTVKMYDCRNVYIRSFTFSYEPEESLLGPTDVPYLYGSGDGPLVGTRRSDGDLESGPYRDSRWFDG